MAGGRWYLWRVVPFTILLAVPFLITAGRTNPPVMPWRTLEARMRVPGDVSATLHRACYDCHSNETRWPWYSRIRPAGALLANDVDHARKVMNFSEWPARKKGGPDPMLLTVCAVLESGLMPKPHYLWLHPGAKLTPVEISQFCAWAHDGGAGVSPRAALPIR